MRIVAFFIRHALTDFNKQENGEKEKFRGDADIPLNEEGKQQAEQLVPLFNAREFSSAFHSGMQRTAQTLEPLMKSKNMKSVEVEKLDSLDTGDFTGLPKTKENKEKLEWYRENPKVKIPGGESVANFRNRIDPRLMRIIKQGDEAGKPTIACVHGSVVKELSRMMTGDYDTLKVDPGGVVAVYKTPFGYFGKPIVKENPAGEDILPGS